MNQSKKTVIVIDDSGYMRSLIKTALEKAGYQIVGEAGSGELAIDLCIKLKPDLITLDNILPDMHGMDILKAIREEGVTSEVLMVSGLGQSSIVEEAKTMGATDYVVKPFDSHHLVEVANQIFRNTES
ncbi:MAG: response regulator [Reichenbachiella sp.]|uniref:response regulator n=1 Tax=Reichenbachiella sp. TaxID=2184521 RepID=UPI003264D188